MSETVTYRGCLVGKERGDAMDILFLDGMDEPLAETVRDDMERLGSFLTVRYFVADEVVSIEDLEANLVRQIVGAGDADYGHRYSEITGYLWTDEEINVGGHDLLQELRSKIGKFCHLEITYSGEKTPD